MLRQVYFEDRVSSNIVYHDVASLKHVISQQHGAPTEDLYVTINGKIVSDDYNLLSEENAVRVCTKLVGGKGGFGSMLRAIGAQIEKTTNREACRDLSGRRLRDINEEKRLRKWLDGQEDRDREAVERKQKKLERLLAEPKIDVNLDPSYEKERQELPERVGAAVDAGWSAAGSSKEGLKRKAKEEKSKVKKKKLWIDDLSDCSSSSDDDEPESAITEIGQNPAGFSNDELKQSETVTDDLSGISSLSENEQDVAVRPTLTVSSDSGHDSDQSSEVSNKV